MNILLASRRAELFARCLELERRVARWGIPSRGFRLLAGEPAKEKADWRKRRSSVSRVARTDARGREKKEKKEKLQFQRRLTCQNKKCINCKQQVETETRSSAEEHALLLACVVRGFHSSEIIVLKSAACYFTTRSNLMFGPRILSDNPGRGCEARPQNHACWQQHPT